MSTSLNTVLSKPLIDELNSVSQLMTVDKGTELLRDGQYVKVVPIVLSGSLKVYIKNEDRELLLYYIKPNESCIMSFSACLENAPSKVYAVTEEETEILAIPVSEIDRILKKHPEFNRLFYSLYNERYIDLIKTINSVLFNKLDSRILSYLKEKSVIHNSKQIKVTHKQIALDLGSSREVISRTLKKLEIDGHVILHNSLIEIL
jgi:CRP/FNR family transcriptional regulator